MDDFAGHQIGDLVAGKAEQFPEDVFVVLSHHRGGSPDLTGCF